MDVDAYTCVRALPAETAPQPPRALEQELVKAVTVPALQSTGGEPPCSSRRRDEHVTGEPTTDDSTSMTASVAG